MERYAQDSHNRTIREHEELGGRGAWHRVSSKLRNSWAPLLNNWTDTLVLLPQCRYVEVVVHISCATLAMRIFLFGETVHQSIGKKLLPRH